MIRMRDSGEIITFDEFKRRSNTSFPNGVIPPGFVEAKGGDVILEGAQPTGAFWQYAIRDGVEQIGNKWYWKYILGPVFTSQAEQDAYVQLKTQELHRGHEISVNEERARRILTGKTFSIGNPIKNVFLVGTQTDKDNLSDLAFAALMRQGNNPNHLTTFRDGNNVDHQLKPAELLELWSVAAAYVSGLYQKSWAIKAMNPIPSDFTNDTYWN